MAEEGVNVTVFDGNGLASGGSRMHHSVLHPRLLADGSPNAAYRISAFQFATQYLRRFNGYRSTPVLHVESDDVKQKRFARIGDYYDADDPNQDWLSSLSPSAGSAIAKTDIQNPCFLFHDAAVINLPQICAELLQHSNIEFVREPGQADDGVTNFVCAGAASRHFDSLDWLEVNAIGGRLHELAIEAAALPPVPVLPIVGNGYLIPTRAGAVVGSTYEYRSWSEHEALNQNLAQNQQYLPSTFEIIGQQQADRAISSDRNAIVGQIDDNLWISTAHGSMGTSSAPFAAAILVSKVLTLAPVTDTDVVSMLAPDRFKERQARRGPLKRDHN